MGQILLPGQTKGFGDVSVFMFKSLENKIKYSYFNSLVCVTEQCFSKWGPARSPPKAGEKNIFKKSKIVIILRDTLYYQHGINIGQY